MTCLSLSSCCRCCPTAAVSPLACDRSCPVVDAVLRAPRPAHPGLQFGMRLARPHIPSGAIGLPSNGAQPARSRARRVRSSTRHLLRRGGFCCRSVATHGFIRSRSGRSQGAARDVARLGCAEPELAAVEPHAVHDHRQPAVNCDGGVLVAAPFCDAQNPALSAPNASGPWSRARAPLRREWRGPRHRRCRRCAP